MDDPFLRTTQLHDWLDRFQAGDRAAADELLRATGTRLERLARRMLKGFPNVKRWFAAVRARPAVQRGTALGKEWRKAAMDDEARRHLFGAAAGGAANPGQTSPEAAT